MFTNRPARRQRGISLVELVMFIVIVSTAVVGILQVFSLTTSRSADPLLRKQALSIAEGLLEEVELAGFTFCDPTDAQADVATGAFVSIVAPLGCAADATIERFVQEVGGVARPFDNVNDYVDAAGTRVYMQDAAGANFPAGYTATVAIAPDAAFGPAAAPIPQAAVLRITVTVAYGNDNVVLEGYRVRYAPN